MSALNMPEIYGLDKEGTQSIVVKHFPLNIGKECLQMYLEHMFGVQHLSLVLPHPGCSIAVASLDVEVTDFISTYQENVFSNPIKKGCYPDLEMLGSPKGIYLEDVPELVDSSDITSYFEGFATVDNVKHTNVETMQCFAVTIPDMRAVHSLILMDADYVCGQIITLQPYYPTVHDHILNYIQHEANKEKEIEAPELCQVKEKSDEIQTELIISNAQMFPAKAVEDDSLDETENSSSVLRLAKPTPISPSLIDENSEAAIYKQPLKMYVGPSFTKTVFNPSDNYSCDTVSWSPVRSYEHHPPNVAAVKPFCVRKTSRDNDLKKEQDMEAKMASSLSISKDDQSCLEDEDLKETHSVSVHFKQSPYETDTDDELNGAVGGGVNSNEESDECFEYLKTISDESPVVAIHRKQHRYNRWQGGLDEKAALKQALLLSMQDRSMPVNQSSYQRPERMPQSYVSTRKQNTTTRVSSNTRAEQVNGVSVKIMKAQISKYKADALVNVVSASGQDPFNNVVAKSFLDVGGPGLLQGFQMSQRRLITSTQSTGNLQCKTVLHVKIDKGSDCKQVVDTAMVKILDECEKSGCNTVAIPPIGVGRMFRFPAPVVAERMLKQIYIYIGDIHRNLSLKEINIVIDDDDTFHTFDGALTDIARKNRNPLHLTQRNQMNPAHGHVKGHHPHSQSARHVYRDIRSQDSDRNTSNTIQRNSVRGGTEKAPRTQTDIRLTFIKMMASESPEVPKYWNNYKPDTPVTQLLIEPLKHFLGRQHEKVTLKADTPEYTEIIKMINATFDPRKVGHGADATGIPQGSYQQLRVLKIRRIENLELYEKFALRRKACFRTLLNSRAPTYPVIKDLPNCKGAPVTSCYCDGVLGRDMHSNINEYLFFHGTKLESVDVVCNNGLDPKLGNKNAMLGQGIYGAEQSTKADQYTDAQDKRSYGQGNKKKMFLIRMILGNSYVSSDPNPRKYKQPPCTKCYRDDCSKADHGKGKFGHFFHSVIGDNSKLFREFVVYDSDLCYPEYLITYERL